MQLTVVQAAFFPNTASQSAKLTVYGFARAASACGVCVLPWNKQVCDSGKKADSLAPTWQLREHKRHSQQ